MVRGGPGSQLPWSAAVGYRCGRPGKPEAPDSTGTLGALESRPLSRRGDSERPTRGKRSAAPASCPLWIVNLARGSLVGSEPGAAENVQGRDRAPTHSSLCTEPPTYFNPPPSLLPLPRDSTPPPPAPQPCPCACALRNKVLLTRAADFGSCAHLAPASRDLRPQPFRPVRSLLCR